MDYRCKYCLIRSTEKVVARLDLDNSKKDLLINRLFCELAEDKTDFLIPEVAASLHRIIKDFSGVEDPCFEEKDMCNRLAENYYQKLQILTETGENIFETAVRISIAGNIMDMAAVPDFMDKSSEKMNEVLKSVLEADFAINDVVQLQKAIKKAKTILVLGDNCGEIVFDRLLLETINKPKVYYAVKDKPVMNDATKEDAYAVGLDRYCTIISNGYDAPSTILNKCSDEFIEIYRKADVIISKGQGNLEGLFNEEDSRLFFLLMVKCPVIAESINVPVKSFIVMNSITQKTNNHKSARN